MALVYDRVNKWGGAERVLLALHEIWPDVPLFTAVYDADRARWADVFSVHPSFLQKFPFAKNHHEFYPWATPLAFESFTFDAYDIVLSVTSAEAKGIITKPQTRHICYCLTPTRYLWSGYSQYQESPGWGILNGAARVIHKSISPTLRRWDTVAAARPDAYIAISKRVAERIAKYYRVSAIATIYPPVDLETFTPNTRRPATLRRDAYYLVVSRLVGHKRLDIIIDAFNRLQWPLLIIGDGVAKADLVRRADANVRFIDHYLTDEELAGYYGNCRAYVFAGEEDFGLSAVEAQACGKPVIAYRESGIAEIIEDGKTGVLFHEQSAPALISALTQFASQRFDQNLCRSNVSRFSYKFFQEQIRSTVTEFRDSHLTV